MQIEAYQGGVPDWGLSVGTGGDGHYFRKLGDEGIYQRVTGDAAFTLLGPPVRTVCLPLIYHQTQATNGNSAASAWVSAEPLAAITNPEKPTE